MPLQSGGASLVNEHTLLRQPVQTLVVDGGYQSNRRVVGQSGGRGTAAVTNCQCPVRQAAFSRPPKLNCVSHYK